eukprot:jgi/Chrzof1/4549/Cz14g17250.t1
MVQLSWALIATTLVALSATVTALPACRITFNGSTGFPVSNASVICTGGGITAAASESLLAEHVSSFQGVKWDQAQCGNIGCLFTICGQTQATLVHTSISSVNATDLIGILCISQDSKIEIRQSTFGGNTAINGTIHVRDAATVLLQDSIIRDNLACGGNYGLNEDWNGQGAGGGLHAQDSARVSIVRSVFSGNVASWGGAMCAADNASINSINSTFTGNHALIWGGAAAACDSGNVKFTDHSVVSSNTAAVSGGGADMCNFASLTVSNHSTFRNNSAGTGAGADATESAIITVIGNSTFIGNRAVHWGGGAHAANNGSILVTNSKLIGNSAAYGGGVNVEGSATAVIADYAEVIGNHADQGGGIYAKQEVNENLGNKIGEGKGAGGIMSVVIRGGSNVSHNSASFGGGLFAGGSCSVAVTSGSSFTHNTAINQGGGLYISFDASINLSADTVIHSNKASLFGGGVFVAGFSNLQNVSSALAATANNTAGFAPDISVPPDTMAFTPHAPTIAKYISKAAPDQGLIHLAVRLTAGYDQRDAAGNTSRRVTGVPVAGIRVQISVTPSSPVLLGNQQQSNKDGIATFKEFKLLAAPGNYNLTVSAPDYPSVKALSFPVMVHGCEVGEVFNAAGNACDSCGLNYYSLNPINQSCDQCPAHTACPGRDGLQPKVGYWHSSNYSTQVHKCPNAHACRQSSGAPNTTTDWQCTAGYSSNLCGKCSAAGGVKYGTMGAFKCGVCPSKAAITALFVLSASILIILNFLTVHYTCRDNEQIQDKKEVWPTDVIKVLVLYLQYVVIVGSAPVDWPRSLEAVFTGVSWVFAAGTSQVVSLDCMYEDTGPLPAAVKRVLTYLIGPFAVVVAMVLAYAVRYWVKVGDVDPVPYGVYLVNKLPVICIVVLYCFFYPFLVRSAWSMLACYQIDDDSQGLYPQYLKAVGSYWVFDVEQKCWEGWHMKWALALGVPCVVVFCVGVPVGIVLILSRNRSRLKDLSFRMHFGFMYRNFTEHCCWWEAVVAVQTVVLVAISVFSSTLGAAYELLMFCVVFAVSIMLHQWFRPFLIKRLYHLQLTAYMCLFTICIIALSFLPLDRERESPALYKEVAGVVLLVFNAGFFAFGVYNLAVVTKGPISRAIKVIKKHPWSRAFKARFMKATACCRRVKSFRKPVKQAVASQAETKA